jgi:hypothetical protein
MYRERIAFSSPCHPFAFALEESRFYRDKSIMAVSALLSRALFDYFQNYFTYFNLACRRAGLVSISGCFSG